MPNRHDTFHSANGKRTILVVDDESINRYMLGVILQDTYEVLFAEDGIQALETVEAHKDTLSLILLDLLMPQLHGLEVLKRLKENPECNKIPVIVMTSEQSAEVESLQLGAIDFIPKPYPQPQVVLARVLRTIELCEDRDIIQSTERDNLTGLYNREFFYRYVEQYDQHHKDVSTDAIVIDVNHFHMVNERYGKAYGDEVLQRVAANLQEAVREWGGIVCRRQSDTFLIYCPNGLSYEDLLDRASQNLSGQDTASNNRIRLRMGVYSDADKSIDIERRFDRAKLAADTVRNSFARTIALYDNALHESELYSEQLIEDFHTAIQQRQFQVYYQPKFDIRGDTPILASAEALVRWVHPELGMISPGRFIPLFENNGLIEQLDLFVWRETAAQIRDWKNRFGVGIPVSVNVSRIDMYDPNLPNTFQSIINEFGLEPGEILLEITESAYTEDSDQIIETVIKLRSMGFRIEMDDFGTGYSSLGMLSRLPIDALKLDMIFVRNAFNEHRDVRMLELIIDIANYLSVSIIAEGVETEEQMITLKAMGCDLVQGYYFSKPIPATEFERFIEERSQAEPARAAAQSSDQPVVNDTALQDRMNISHALSGGFESVYYVDLSSGYYIKFDSHGKYAELPFHERGADFFQDAQQDVLQVVHPEDQSKMLAVMNRDYLRSRLDTDQSFSLTYRLLFDGEPLYYTLKAVRTMNSDDQHVVLGVNCVEEEMREARLREEAQIKHATAALSAAYAQEYESLYHVNLQTDAYTALSMRYPGADAKIMAYGVRFFDDCQHYLLTVVYSADQAKVSFALRKENVIASLETDGYFQMDYRLMFDGQPVYYRMKGEYYGEDKQSIILGNQNIDAQISQMDKFMDAEQASITYIRIAQALSQDYFNVYYVNTENDRFMEFKTSGPDHMLTLERIGEDFFEDCKRTIPLLVPPEDCARALAAFDRETILRETANGETFSIAYRLTMDGKMIHASLKALRLADDENHIVIGVSNIDAQVQWEKEYEAAKAERVTYASIAQALAADYFSIYYVDPDTDRFIEFSSNEAYRELGIEQSGEDFFNLSRKNILEVVHPDDQELIRNAILKENILRELEQSGTFTMNYRLMFGGQPTYVSMKATRMEDENNNHIVIGVNNIDAQMRRLKAYERAHRESATYASIAQALAADYFSIYYVDVLTDHFIQYNSHEKDQTLDIENVGEDFFNATRQNMLQVVYPEDQDQVTNAITKENILRDLDQSGTFLLNFRLMSHGQPTYVSLKASRMSNDDRDHIVVGISNIDAQVQRQKDYERAQAETLTYSRLAEALSRDYLCIYLVDEETDEFVEYNSHSAYQHLQVEESGKDFFEASKQNIQRLVYPDDLEKALAVWDKQRMLRELENHRTFSTTYRLVMNDEPVYLNLKVTRITDGTDNRHIVIGISNVDAQMKSELELNAIREIANRDPLTGVKSKHAYLQTEKELNDEISLKETVPFSIVVCDVNGLKQINDTLGHKAGDRHIKNASKIICTIFKHSPVYRIGGDEFVAILRGQDYEHRKELMEELTETVEQNIATNSVVVAGGIADFIRGQDLSVAAVFERADQAMYENKTALKK